MKYLNKAKLRRLFFVSVFALSISISYSQHDVNPGDGDVGDPDDEEQDENVPIDGGLSVLLAAGAAYVGKKAYDKKNIKENSESS